MKKLVMFALSGVFFLGCGSDGEEAGECIESNTECQTYTPDEVDGEANGTLADAESEGIIPIQIGDVGGGLVAVTLSALDPTSVIVRLAGAPEDQIHEGVDTLVSDERSTRSFTFRAQGNKSYELVVKALGNTPSSYDVFWEYEPNVDCFEPNDTLATAKNIALNAPVQAYAHAGIIEGDGLLVGPGMLDYYSFELPSAAKVKLRVKKPSDTALSFEFWNADTDASYLVGTDHLAEANDISESDELELPAGVHHVRVSSFASQPSSVNDDGTFPADWNQPYELTVLAPSITNICEPDDMTPAPQNNPSATNECIDYTPASVSGTYVGNWAGKEIDKTTIDVSDPGGGLVQVTLNASIPTEAQVRLPGAGDEAVHYGVDVLVSDDRDERFFTFRAQGQTTYDLELVRLKTPEEGDVLDYSLTWTYAPNYDCYEVNDTPSQAREIPLDTVIEAFAHPGITDEEGLLVGPGADDYYKFVLEEPTTVALSMIKPGESALVAEFYTAEDVSHLVGTDALAPAGQETTSEDFELPPGTHWIKVSVPTQESVTVDDDPIPADWNNPYKLQVKRRN